MSSIIHITNKTSGITYAYESHSYWDKDAKAPRTRRVYLGRVDENGNIIPKKNKSSSDSDGNQSTTDTTDYKRLCEKLSTQNSVLQAKVDSLEASLSAAQKALTRLYKLLDSQKESLDSALRLLKEGANV